MVKKVMIVDYGMGNLDSVARSTEEAGGDPIMTDQPRVLKNASYVILPGVGSFADGMRNIRELEMGEALKEQVLQRQIPLLGLCLGMQLLANRGWEGGETEGLGFIEGEVKRLEVDSPDTRIPHIGWNEVVFTQDCPLFRNIPSGKDFYFVHSYHLICKDANHILATTPYCGGFVSVVGKDNIFGVQFHPEKSQYFGIELLKNFLSQ